MLMIVLALVIVQGYAQKRTATDHIDWAKMSEEISRSVEESLTGLDIDLSDMELQIKNIPEFTMDSNTLKELSNIKVYAYNMDVQGTGEELKAQRETERARREAERARREAERAQRSNNKTYSYAYSYNSNESQQSSKGDTFENLSNIKGVEVVYITKALLGMMPDMDMPGVNVGKVAGKLESLQIYSAEDRSPAIILKQTISRLVKSGNYETLMFGCKCNQNARKLYITRHPKSDKRANDKEVTVQSFSGRFRYIRKPISYLLIGFSQFTKTFYRVTPVLNIAISLNPVISCFKCSPSHV